MLATFGLDRLETGLTRDTESIPDVATVLPRPGTAGVDTPARDRTNGAGPRSRTHQPAIHALTGTGATPDLPTRYYPHRAVNPEFQPTRHANRV